MKCNGPRYVLTSFTKQLYTEVELETEK